DQGPQKSFLGYIARSPSNHSRPERQFAAKFFADAFPTGDPPLDRELARLLAMLEADAPGLLEQIAEKWTSTSRAQDDIHYLMVAARLPGKRSETATKQTAYALNAIHAKLAAAGNPPS